MQDKDYLSPLSLFNDPVLLTASRSDLLPQNVEIIRDLRRAMFLENDQDLPVGYRIWSDALTGAVAPFFTTAKAREGREIIDARAEEIWASKGNFELELKKKRIKKTITEHEEFWLTVAYDILETLKSVALARYIGGTLQSKFLEDTYATLQAGFFPCGLRADNGIVAFDPSVLTG